jgi:CRP-like cAMP-binding protein
MGNPRNNFNRVLAEVSPRRDAGLQGQLEPVRLKSGQILYEPGELIRHVYFPIDCLVCLLTVVDVRHMLEVGMIGNEGLVGMASVLGAGASQVRALVLRAGDALRMASGHFQLEFVRNRLLRRALLLHTHTLMAQIAQTAACNRFHATEARLARWLLMTRDRVKSDEFSMTHAFLAQMLGMRREGITDAAGLLRRRNLIDYHRGTIRLRDIRGLEAMACSCYRIMKNLFNRAARGD